MAAMAYPNARLDMARVGIAVYGYAPSPALKGIIDLRPVMELRSFVSYIRKIHAGDSAACGGEWRANSERVIATLPIGYADGIRRSLSPGLFVEILGEACPVRGRVCMDRLMAELPGGMRGRPSPRSRAEGRPKPRQHFYSSRHSGKLVH